MQKISLMYPRQIVKELTSKLFMMTLVTKIVYKETIFELVRDAAEERQILRLRQTNPDKYAKIRNSSVVAVRLN